MEWLRRTTRFQRISLGLLTATVLLWVFARFNGSTPAVFVVLAVLIAFFAFRKQLLWRVRNRLLLTFFLVGVVPVVLVGLMFLLSLELALGQFVVQRTRQGLDAQIKLLESVARNPALSTEVPGILEREGKYYLGFPSLNKPLDDEMVRAMTDGSVTLGAIFQSDDDLDIELNSTGARVLKGPQDKRVEVRAVRLPPSKGFWDLPIPAAFTQDVEGSNKEVVIVLLTRVSSLTAGFGSGAWAQVSLAILAIAGGFLLLVELVSLISSIGLTRTITRSVHDLYQGTQLVAAGDFSHQIPVRGDHQLSELATSFNSMTSKIRHYVGEMRKKDRLESEIEIARQVQARLFPRTVPQLRTLTMAGVCLPGRFISGDYYDFVRLDDQHTAIALGDVSGKGVSAALLMASIQSALHTQLRFSGTDQNPSLSTATLMALISQQLYESTPPEKYATFFCSVYNDDTGMLYYTNCGHLRPILIRAGQVQTLTGDGMVVGLLPKVHYEQHEIQLLEGDVLVIFSDGVSEAENGAGKEFGEDRLAQLLTQHSDRPIEEILQTVTGAIRAWVHDPEGQDDTTIVVMRRI